MTQGPHPSPATPAAGRRGLLDRLSLWQVDAAGLGLCAALAAVWYFAGLQPLQQAKADRIAAEGDLLDKGREVERLQGERADAEAAFKQVESEISLSKVRLEAADHVNERVAGLTALARDQGLQLDEIKPGLRTALARYTTVPIHVSGSGPYSRCAAFLTELHGRFPDVGVTSMELRAEPATPDRPPHFMFDLVWYSAPDRAPARK